MKKPSFKDISQSLLDAWISSSEELGHAEQIYGGVADTLRPSMMLIVADLKSSGSRDFIFDFVRRYRLPSELPDQNRLASSVVPAIVDAVDRQRPVIGRTMKTSGAVYGVYDYIVLPQRTSRRHGWCVALLDIKLLLPTAAVIKELDDVDLAIIQLLSEGASAKDISLMSGLSPRTIEHRIERLKTRFGARSIAHLVALSISAALGGTQ